ncbi:MAG: hypothetical protein RLN76_04630 [Phycisphaeraceae bacterium]
MPLVIQSNPHQKPQRHRWVLIILQVALLVALCLAAPSHAQTTNLPDELPNARDYLNRIQQGIERIREQLPEITNAANLIADHLVERDLYLGVMGSDGLAAELSHRPGALTLVSGEPGRTGEPVIYIFGVRKTSDPPLAEHLRNQVDEAQRLRGSGVLIGIAPFKTLEQHNLLKPAQEAVDVLIDSDGHDQPHGAPTLTVLNTIAAWTLQAELFAACTRRDKVPVVVISDELDRLQRHSARYAGQRFMHDRWLEPIPPQTLGDAYLTETSKVLRNIGTASWHTLSDAARRAGRSLADGGSIFILPGGRQPPRHLGNQLADDPNALRSLSNARPGERDMVIALGEHHPPNDPWWGEQGRYRSAGRGVVWVIASYGQSHKQLRPGDAIIDTWGPVGDAVVRIEPLDLSLGPVSAVTTETIAWMLSAQIPAEADYLLSRRLDRQP